MNRDMIIDKIGDLYLELDCIQSDFMQIDNLYYRYIDEDEYINEFNQVNSQRERLLNEMSNINSKINELEKQL